jgi:hypothetical protein
MRTAIDSLKMAIDAAENLVYRAEVKGVEGGQARFDLGAAKDNLTRVRSVVHTFDPAQVTEITAGGMVVAHSVRETAQESLDDLRARRIGLGVSVVLVALVALALWWKIKAVDRRTDFTKHG